MTTRSVDHDTSELSARLPRVVSLLGILHLSGLRSMVVSSPCNKEAFVNKIILLAELGYIHIYLT